MVKQQKKNTWKKRIIAEISPHDLRFLLSNIP